MIFKEGIFIICYLFLQYFVRICENLLIFFKHEMLKNSYKMNKQNKLTPLMKQYFQIREQYPDELLMFQVGDFYEFFFEDAKKVSSFLGIALTKRGFNNGNPIPLCGVPVHTLDHYITKLIKGGFRLAVCDQLEEATPGKVVQRGVTKVLTPGTLTDSNLLDEKSASYLFSFFPTENQLGLLFGELLTAQLFATVLPTDSEKSLESEIVRFFPDEVLLPKNKLGKKFQSKFKRLGYFTTLGDIDLEDVDSLKHINEWVAKQFKKDILGVINKHNSLLYSLYNFYKYVSKNRFGALEHFRSLHFYKPDDFLILDPSTRKNIELIKNNQDGSRKNTLFSLMDKAATSMGSRMVKKWIMRPLIKKDAIEQRLDVVGVLSEQVSLNQKLHELLIQIGDIERIVGRIALCRATVNDYLMLKGALEVIPDLQFLFAEYTNVILLKIIVSHLGDFHGICSLLHAAINDDSTKEWIIKRGFNQKLDELREIIENSNQKILALEKQEQKATGIGSLKVRYNKVHGYYIEVTKPNLHLVPDSYVRQQTLVNRERFTNQQLRDLQYEIASASATIDQVEKEIFEHVKREVYQHITQLRKSAHALAHLDALLSFANVAYENGYVRPIFNPGRDITVTQGRHPVVEMSENINFIPNDTALNDEQSLWIVTGPNMGGKSTFLRQVALICIMAQCGSFVSAKSAQVAILDRIFTRIGSGDNLAGGKSTFLVEMEETALICNQATQNSLVILDEVGRGTSTFDGLAIAQAVVEYIHTKIQARCLFATHYHELTELKDIFPGISSYYAASKRTQNGIVFLYKIIKGVADGSFGLEVAKLAQLPDNLVVRAEAVLHTLEQVKHADRLPQKEFTGAVIKKDGQNSMLLAQNRALEGKISNLQRELEECEKRVFRLKNVDYNELSPKKALDLLWELKEM